MFGDDTYYVKLGMNQVRGNMVRDAPRAISAECLVAGSNAKDADDDGLYAGIDHRSTLTRS